MIQFADIQSYREFKEEHFKHNQNYPAASSIDAYNDYIKNMRKYINEKLYEHLEYAQKNYKKVQILQDALDFLDEKEVYEAFLQFNHAPLTEGDKAKKRMIECIKGEDLPTDAEADELNYRVKVKKGEW